MKISVLIVEDHLHLRQGIEQTLKRINFISEIKQAGDGKEALGILRQKPADVTLLDIHMPKGMNGHEAALKIQEEKINTKVIAYSMFDSKVNIDMMLHAGAMGFITKNTDRDELETAILTVHDGRYYFSTELLPDALELLREFETGTAPRHGGLKLEGLDKIIIDGIRKGKKEQEIADENNVSLSKVKYHLKKMYDGYAVSNAPELIDYLHRNGLMGF